MCLSPVTVPTQSRYISLSYRDRFLQTFSCGHCAECMRLASMQWQFRANAEFDDLPPDGYVMFDCLSYRPKDLPHLSQFWFFIDGKHEDYPCFDRLHLRKFWNLFRTRLVRLGYDPNDFRHYYACEYGTARGRTHRPHIHIMIYVHDSRMSPDVLSKLVSDLWSYGRTDGIPYKPMLYVMSHNVVKANNTASRLRTVAYITKYLQKQCEFQAVLNARIAKVMRRMAEYVATPRPDEDYYPTMTADEWLETELARRERLKLIRMVNQFHRSSQNFGASALANMDYNELVRFGVLVMPSSDTIKLTVPLSTYYKRKLFYELVNVDGARYWQLNDLGKEFYEDRKPYLLQDMKHKLDAMASQANERVDTLALSNYILDSRGRIKADVPSTDIMQRVDKLDYYNYMTSSDKLQFGQRGLSRSNFGSAQLGYNSSRLCGRLSHSDFIKKYVILDDVFENQLDILNRHQIFIRRGKQDAYELRQRLEQLYKMLL